MATLNKLTGHEWNDLPLFAEGTPVSLSVKQVIAKVKKILAICGLGYETPLASYDPTTQSWRMSVGICPLGEQPSLPILPPSGMTRNGALFQQPAWEPLTGVTASLSWPTPTAVTRPMEGNVRLYRAKVEAGEMTETEAEAMLGKSVWEAQGKIPAMWPTPRSSSAMNEDIATLTERLQNGTPYKARLEEAVAMWPTPRAALGDARNHTVYARSMDKPQNLENKVATADPSAVGGKLNPTWVEWLMGFPTGWTDLED